MGEIKSSKTTVEKKITLIGAISIGIGAMVGGGIFSVLGLSVTISKGATPIAFLIAGILALFTSYSYAKLSLVFPNKGGTVTFLNKGLKSQLIAGSFNNLLWISYIIMLSLYASTFAFYMPNLYTITGDRDLDFHIYASAIVLLAMLINYGSIAMIGKIEIVAMFVKLSILVGFVVVGILGVSGNQNLAQLGVSHWAEPFAIFSGGMMIFLSYEGFELIANASSNLEKPEVNIARAYYISVIFTILLYLGLSVVTVGSLSFADIALTKNYVLAEAAKPMLGNLGFSIVSIAALVAAFSALTASLFGSTRVNQVIAEDKELPSFFLHEYRSKPIGLLFTSLITLVLVNILKLESISTAGSVGFLVIFCVVNFIGFRLSDQIKAKKFIPLLGSVLCAIATLILLSKELQRDRLSVVIAVGIIVFCFVAESLYNKVANRKR